MANNPQPALTPEQWAAKDYRQPAHDLDRWSEALPGASGDDATEYVAKLGLTDSGSVVIMNRAHDRVLVPPPARAALAAFALAEQPFGFTAADVQAVLRAADRADASAQGELQGLAERLQALLPQVSGQGHR
jgi:hypothetical protein